MEGRFLNILKYILGWPISVLALGFIIKLIAPQIPKFASSITQINFLVLSYGILSFITYYFIRSYIWYRMVSLHSNKISFRTSSYFFAISEVKRYIPGSIISFLGRTVLFSEMGIQKKVIGKLLLAEAVILVLGALSISFLSLPFLLSYFMPQLSIYSYLLIVLAIIAVFLAVYYLNKKLKLFKKSETYEYIFFVFLSTCGMLFFGFGNYFAISSFITLPIQMVFQLVGFFVFSFLLGYISILTPAGFGVREGTVILGLSKVIPLSVSALMSVFSRIILIFSELLFIFITFVLFKAKSKKIKSIENWISQHKHISILIALSAIYIIYITTASFLRYDNFYAGRFDLGNMAQTVWNTSRGRIFEFTNPNGTSNISRLSTHADFILILLAPIYAIFPDPRTLLFIQALIVAAGSICVYLIAKDNLKNENLSLAFGISYLLNPSIQRANLYDFHPVTLVTTFLLAMYYFYSRKKYLYFGIFAILAAITKEQIWLIVGLFGVLMAFQHKKRLLGLCIFLLSTGIFYFLVSVAIPKVLGSSHFALSYYSDLGDTPFSIIKNTLFSPQKILSIVLMPDRIDYLIQIFSPVGYLLFFAPQFMIFAVPDLLINLLSNNPQLHQIYYQYTAAITPFIFISSIYAVKNILKISQKIKHIIFTFYILIIAFYTAYLYGPLPGAKGANTDMFTKKAKEGMVINNYLSKIPKGASVAASNNIGSHLSERKEIYTLPLGIDKADIVVFYLNETESVQSIEAEKTQLKKIQSDKNYKKELEYGAFAAYKKINK